MSFTLLRASGTARPARASLSSSKSPLGLFAMRYGRACGALPADRRRRSPPTAVGARLPKFSACSVDYL